MNPIVYAIPVFFALMALEWAIARARQQQVYRLGDTISSVGLGAMSQVLGLYTKLISLGIYVLAYQHLSLWQLPTESLWVWLAALLFYDFLYYWNHRFGHEVALFWAAHVVHHQSEDYNLGTALRQSSSSFIAGWIFYLPMAVLGFPPLVFAVVALIDLLYQYWIHTEQIRRLGWFDRVFASPSNHRVHHAVNERYVDKNYGGILIIWDRLFGSFTEERDDDPVVYGTRKPLRSLDPIWANLEVYVALAKDSWRTRSWADKLRVWLKPPGWRPADLAALEPAAAFDIRAVQKYHAPLRPAAGAYAALLFVLLVGAGTFVLALDGKAPLPGIPGTAFAVWIVLSLWALGRWTDARSASREMLCIVLATGAAVLFWQGALTGLAAGIAMLLSGLAFGAWFFAPQTQPKGAEAMRHSLT